MRLGNLPPTFDPSSWWYLMSLYAFEFKQPGHGPVRPSGLIALAVGGLIASYVACYIARHYTYENAAINLANAIEKNLEAGSPSGSIAPEPRQDPVAQKRFQALRENIKVQKPEIVFIGDSITQGFEFTGELWQASFAPYKVFNAGISSDRFQHILYRIQNGQLAFHPKLVVLNCGVNNLTMNSTDQIAQGILQVIDAIHRESPESRVLLLGVFPAGRMANMKVRQKILAINEQLTQFGKLPLVTYADIGEIFIEKTGFLTEQISYDAVHLTRKGYELWSEALKPLLTKILSKDI